MSLFITSLNSGSNGNCYYVGNDREALLVDAGISCREIEKRMKRLGLPMQRIKAVFISHEHSDHISGLTVLVHKYRIPVYITQATLKQGGLRLDPSLVYSFSAREPVTIGSLVVTAFPKMHDAIDPHSFVISCGKVKVGVFTDIGTPCEQLIRHFSQCNAAFLESNYDEETLAKGNYPYFLKKRISGDNGHLSNSQALELFKAHKPAFMSHLLLSHLSKNNNTPDLAAGMFKPHANSTEIIVASRFRETAVIPVREWNPDLYAECPVQSPQLELF